MARIVAHIESIPGESEVSGYENHLDAVAIRETLEIPASASGRPTDARHSDIMLTRIRDRGSPKLAQACAAGTNLGDITISLYRSVGGVVTVYMSYALKQAYVSRYEYDTADEHGLAYMPHFGPPGQPLAQPVYGIASLLDAPAPDRARLSPRPMVAQPRGLAGRRDVERVWFNSARLEWLYRSGTDTVTRRYDIRRSESY